MFKIQRSDGLFSSGGENPTWSKNGKIWKQRGHVTSHLGLVSRREYADADVVEYEMTEKRRVDASEWKLAADDRKEQRRLEAKAMVDAYRKSERRREYQKLKKEFEHEDLS
jgi:hypothetical protein